MSRRHAEPAGRIEHPSRFAVLNPAGPATIMSGSGRTVTYGEMEDRSNRVARMLRHLGLDVGDHLAVLLDNRPEFFEVVWGALRIGVYVTPINWHLATDEAAYIIEDCGASAIVASAALGDIVSKVTVSKGPSGRLAVGGTIPGFDDYESALQAFPGTPVTDQCEGSWMFYSSGTTGRPKGIKPPAVGGPLGAPNQFVALISGLFGFTTDSVYLSPAPLYHAAPAGWTTAVHRLGGTNVVMERFDPLATLAAIEEHRVTHAQFVPTHLVRLLKLSAEERDRFDLSSLEVVVHAAAPCPPEVKRAALDWLGPIVHEYYSGSEGVGFCAIGPEEWLAHPGSVGRSLLGRAHVLDEAGTELPPMAEGEIWFEPPGRFEYHGDPVKTERAFNDRGWSSLGDVGMTDEDGYLYLTDRASNMIISGGVNIYPREIEDVLVGHPLVADVAVIGIPDAEMGEAVRAVVQLARPGEAPDSLEESLIAFCRDRIAHFKCPTSVVVVDALPRLPSGKLAKRMLAPEASGRPAPHAVSP